MAAKAGISCKENRQKNAFAQGSGLKLDGMQNSLQWGLQASAHIRECQCECRYMQTSADHLRYSNEGSGGSDELREACRQGLRFAQKYNAWLEQAAALQALVQAWQQLLAVAITKRWGLLL